MQTVQITLAMPDDATKSDVTKEVKRLIKCGKLWGCIEMSDEPKLSLASVIEAVSEITGIPVHQIKSRKRTRPIADARKFVYFIMCRRGDMGYSRLGSLMELDHTTVLYGCNDIQKRIDKDTQLAAKIDKIYRLSLEVDNERLKKLKQQTKVLWTDPDPLAIRRKERPYLLAKPLPVVRKTVVGNLRRSIG
jgi:hypothetical protein